MTPTGFSDKVPNLRLAWDASTLDAFLRDPLSYYWTYVQGYRTLVPSTPLVWGSLWHEATAFYHEQVLISDSIEDALRRSIRFTIMRAREVDLDGIAANGRKDDAQKRNTYTLVRSLIWWVEEYRHDRLAIEFMNGEPAVEQHFVIPLDMKAGTGEDYLLAGSWDEVVRDDDDLQYIVERKHTTRTLGSWYFFQYDPNVQTYVYDLVGSTVLPHFDRMAGLIVEACQTAVNFSRFDRHPIIRSKEQRDHFLKVIKHWIRVAEHIAVFDQWQYAMNPATTIYDSWAKDLQRRSPKQWPGILKSELIKQPIWNVLEPKPTPTWPEDDDD